MWRLIVGAVAAGLIVTADVTAAAGFWLPPDFGANNPHLAVAVGDSITLGTLSQGMAAQPYPAVLQSLLAPAHPGFTVLNRGVGGETTSEGRARLAGVLAADHPGFVLIMEGTNDATFEMPPEVIVANLRAMVQLAKANSSIPILGTIIPNHRSFAPEAQAIIAQVNAMLPAVAAQEGVRLVNTFTPLSDPGLFGSDALHPTQQGYQVLAAAWQPAVSAAITESQVLLGGVTVAVGNVVGGSAAEIITGAGPGHAPDVRMFNTSGIPVGPGFQAYGPGFLGGVRVAACDFDGDSRDEVLVGPGPGGGPHVRLFKLDAAGNVVDELASFFAYSAGFSGGVFVACGDVDGDGAPEIILGAGRGGGPHVRVLRYDPVDGSVDALFDFFAYAVGFTGGVHVAAGNVDGGDRMSVITGAGAGGGPHVRAIKLSTSSGGTVLGTEIASFLAYAPAFTGGVFVAAGHVTGGGPAEIVTGADAGGGPHVRVFTGGGADTGMGFFAYNPAFTGGVRVAAGNLNAAGTDEIVTGAGPGGGAHVRGFTETGSPTAVSFFAY